MNKQNIANFIKIIDDNFLEFPYQEINNFMKQLNYKYNDLQKENEKLKLLIENLKDCYNCYYSYNDIYCSYYKQTNKICENKNKWVFKNSDLDLLDSII